MKMCQAFSGIGLDTDLVVPFMNCSTKVDDVFDAYGVKPIYSITSLCRNISGGNRLLNRVSIIDFWVSIVRYLIASRPHMVYGRYLPGCYIACLLGIPTAYESHAKIWERTVENYLFLRMLNNPSFKKLVVISEALKIRYQKKYKMNPEKILVAHDGADPVNDTQGIRPWPGRSDCLQVGYTGSAYRGRGLRIIEKVARKLADVDFHVVGSFKQDLENLVGKVIPENLICHGRLPHAVIYRYLNSCDVLLAPYQNKVQVFGGGGNTADFMSPLKIFEYMACGKPIIASDLEVLHEVLDDNNTIFVTADDVDGWVNAVEKTRDSSLRSKMGRNALHKFINNFTWDQRAKNIITKIFNH